IDSESSGSLPMSVSTMTRGLPLSAAAAPTHIGAASRPSTLKRHNPVFMGRILLPKCLAEAEPDKTTINRAVPVAGVVVDVRGIAIEHVVEVQVQRGVLRPALAREVIAEVQVCDAKRSHLRLIHDADHRITIAVA